MSANSLPKLDRVQPFTLTDNKTTSVDPHQDGLLALADLRFCPDIEGEAVLTDRDAGVHNLSEKLYPGWCYAKTFDQLVRNL